MKTLRKAVSVFIPLVMVIQIAVFTPAAASSNRIDPATMAFDEYVTAQFENYAPTFDVGYYVENNPEWLRQATSTSQATRDAFSQRLAREIIDIVSDNPRLFQIKQPMKCNIRVSASVYPDGTVTDLKVMVAGYEYAMTRAEYARAIQDFDRETQRALNYAKAAQNDFERALFIHDYLVLTVAYDKENLDYAIANNFTSPLRNESHTAYGALVDKLAVCEGYARAYMYLLRELGMECIAVTGKLGTVDHMWNSVKIDGRWFHVDATADDPLFENTQDLLGLANHKYFLLSDAALRRYADHSGWSTSLSKATSTMYDNAFFRNVNTSIEKIGDAYYWIDSDRVTTANVRGGNNNHIRKYDIKTKKTSTVHSFHSAWFRNGTENSADFSFSSSSFSRLGSYNGRLYFNTAKEIRSFDPATSNVSVIARPQNLGGTGNRFIFGMAITNSNRLIYTVKTDAGRPDNLARVTLPAATSTKVEVSRTTANLAPKETVALRARLTPSNSTDFIFWTSSDQSVATVDASGTVTAVKAGTATITAFTETGKKATCTVTVK